MLTKKALKLILLFLPITANATNFKISFHNSSLKEMIANTPAPQYSSCVDVINKGGSKGDGVYTLTDKNGNNYKVYCDMANGGWELLYGNYNSASNLTVSNGALSLTENTALNTSLVGKFTNFSQYKIVIDYGVGATNNKIYKGLLNNAVTFTNNTIFIKGIYSANYSNGSVINIPLVFYISILPTNYSSGWTLPYGAIPMWNSADSVWVYSIGSTKFTYNNVDYYVGDRNGNDYNPNLSDDLKPYSISPLYYRGSSIEWVPSARGYFWVK